MTPIQAFYAKMRESHKWTTFWDLDYSGNIKRMFFMHEEQLKLLQRYPDIALADCTYKTNRWKLPLLIILGITPLDTHFPACYCFLGGEKEEDFEWALNSFKTVTEIDISVWLTDRQLALKNAAHKVYPGCKQLLCLWHINKNVLTKVQATWVMPYLPSDEEIQEVMGYRNHFMDRWRGLVRAKTTDEFDSTWEKLKGDYVDQPGLITYIELEWIPRRFEFAMPWTSSITHFGNTSTSRLEATHREVKHYIGGPGNDFQVILERIENHLIKEVHRLDADLANDRIRPPHAVVAPACPITTPILIEKVSNAALLLLAKQYKLAVGQHTPTCTGNFTRLYGIPCCHLIKAILDYSQFKFIELKDIDPHWHYKRPTEEDLSTGTSHDILLRIRAPGMARQRQGRQELNARRAMDHIAREPCAWEGQQILEQAQITRGRARGQRGRPRGSRRGGT